MKKSYLKRAGIENMIFNPEIKLSKEVEKACAFRLFRSLLSVPYYDHSVVTEFGKVCENENEVLSYLYRKCGLNSSYVSFGKRNGVFDGYLKVYVGEDCFIVDVTLSRTLEWGGVERFNEDNFLMTFSEYGLKQKLLEETFNEQ